MRFFVILGLFYGIGARTIKNNYDFAKAVIQSITAQVDKFQQLWVDNKN